ncbi:MAG: hypothetical protein ACREV6_24270 [Clostridium sp.]|uniref:HAMP domain-containing protein n=1 Tax=Clostridium sp. TaxID=1506 RepID=UPI003D6CF896
MKFKVFTLSIIILSTFVIIYSAALIYSKNEFYPTANKGRLLTNSAKINIEQALAKNGFTNEIKSQYSFTVIDLGGRVLSSSITKYKKDMVINLKDFIEYDNKASPEEPGLVKYSTPLIINNTQIGTAIFLISKADFFNVLPIASTLLNILPMIISLIIIIIIAISIYVFSENDILAPLTELHKSARRILKGDFSYKTQYDYDSEIGSFCHDFEAMRDELKLSKEKEIAIKIKRALIIIA